MKITIELRLRFQHGRHTVGKVFRVRIFGVVDERQDSYRINIGFAAAGGQVQTETDGGANLTAVLSSV